MRTRDLLKRYRVLQAEMEEIDRQLHARKANTPVACEKCHKAARVRDLVYIQTHFYVSPYGCTGGDYWKRGEGQYDCPHCGHRNRLYNRPDVEALQHYFGGRADEHEK